MFSIGDVVQLKSGGPHMTVEKVSWGRIYCIWFRGRQVMEEQFHESLLIKIPQTPSS